MAYLKSTIWLELINMNRSIESLKIHVKQAGARVSNPHFWIIVVLMASLAYLYNIPFPNLGIGLPGLWWFRMTEFTLGLTGSLFYVPII